MPVSNPRICVWIISSLFFISVVTGGSFLVLYITRPNTEASWFPVAGVVLVGIPWFFWLLTLVYRCISRACGFRVGGGGGGGGISNRGGNAHSLPIGGGAMPVPTPPDSPVETPGSTARRVRFGEAVVVVEKDSPPCLNQQLDDHSRTSGSSVSHSEYDDISSLESRESELPSAPLMQS